MKRLTYLLCPVFLMLFAAEASAAPITVPPGLNLGDQYRLVFVTSSVRDATSSNIDDYNAFVSGVAAGVPQLAAVGTTWRAIGSTATIDARDNTDTNPAISVGVPIFQLTGLRVAVDNADLWDATIENSIRSENGANQFNFIWTGTRSDGAGDLGDTITHLGQIDPWVGGFNNTDLSWIQNGIRFRGESWSLYGLSGVLTIVPEPGTIILLGIGVTVVVVGHFRCRRHRRLRERQ